MPLPKPRVRRLLTARGEVPTRYAMVELATARQLVSLSVADREGSELSSP